MSAAELIRQMAELPPAERALFEMLFRATQNGARTADATAKASGSWPDFGQRLRHIYGDKIAPHSQSIVDEGRGDR